MGIPDEYKYDFWSREPESLTLTCLMPNGLCIPVTTKPDATFADIKEDLWFEAQKFPLFGKLQDISMYAFSFVNMMAELEIITDESLQLGDVRPMCALLKITEIIQDNDKEQENTINSKIGHLIGKRLHEFDELSSPEINDFRFKMRKLGDEIVTEKQKQSWLQRLKYQFPPRIRKEKDNSLQNIENAVYTKDRLYILGKLSGSPEHKFMFNVKPETSPTELLDLLLKRNEKLLQMVERCEDYVLKACGIDEYLVGDDALINYEYIRESIFKEITPTVVAVSKRDVPIVEGNYGYSNLSNSKKQGSTLTLRKKANIISSWSIDKQVEITLCTISKLNCDIKRNSVEIGVQVGIFHGGKSLCQQQKTSMKLVSEKLDCTINETLNFDINVSNVPRTAKLCFAIYEVIKSGKSTKTRKTKENINKNNPIAWANTTVYDFKNQLRTGAMTLYMWTYAEDMTMMNDELLHPLGTVVSNIITKYTTALTISFTSYGHKGIIQFPSVEEIINSVDDKKLKTEEEILDKTADELEEIKKTVLECDNVYEMHDQDRKDMWKYRMYWKQNSPDILPNLLHCIDWDKKDDVNEVVHLLMDWPELRVEKALELLDYAYSDQQARKFAVKCLENLTNEELLLYLLQLVQALKHELYLDCYLVNFLLKRALFNQKIGHYLFWHLRSEMQVASVSVRFGLILEAYCRASQEHMQTLSKQLDGLQKLRQCSELVRERKDKEKARSAMVAYLSNAHSIESFRNFTSPLDPTYRCLSVKSDKLRVMDSKMRPIWIVFENCDINADDIYIIFKNGDDLRQDMLTLQMLRIMDKLWKQEGLDFRMNPYKCISMDYRVGMIEVVLGADTIANIQKEKGLCSATSAFSRGSIFAWLKDHNKTPPALEKAITEFTLSCAGYCVATYVLGVADRHSDNIMVKKNGQLFHIDFGHILGHFKEKFGFKRERVPFVLTHDFVHVIIKGQKNNSNSIEFKMFQNYCEQAFLILRKHGELILSLFAMMISTGLPELSSEKDLNYLKETLVLSKSEKEAKEHFKAKFEEALSNSWKTSMNWATHNITKSNKV